jgi:hypothetical protein
VTQLLLPLNECTAELLHAAADLAAAESIVEPLHSVADPTSPNETSCLCVWA